MRQERQHKKRVSGRGYPSPGAWTIANPQRPLEAPLSEQLKQAQQEQAGSTRSSSSSSGSSGPSMDLGELMEYDKANYADQMNTIEDITTLQNELKQGMAKYGKNWATKTNRGRQIQQKLIGLKAGATSDWHNSYKHLNDLYSQMKGNDAQEAIAQPSNGSYLVRDTENNNSLTEVATKEFFERPNRYKPVTNNELFQLRQSNQRFARLDDDYGITNNVASVKMGSALNGELDTLFEGAGSKKLIHGVKTLGQVLSPKDLIALKNNRLNIPNYKVKSNAQALYQIARDIQTGTAPISQSAMRGIIQMADKRVRNLGVGRTKDEDDKERSQTYNEALTGAISSILMSKAMSQVDASASEYVDEIEKAKASAPKEANKYDKAKMNPATMAISGLGANVKISLEGTAEKVDAIELPDSQEHKFLGHHMFNRMRHKRAPVKLTSGKILEGSSEISDFMQSTTLDNTALFIGKTDARDGGLYMGERPGDKRRDKKARAEINLKIAELPKMVNNLINKHGFTWEEAYAEAERDMYKYLAVNAFDLADDQSEVTKDHIDEAKNKFQKYFEIHPYLKVQGWTNKSDFRTGERLRKGSNVHNKLVNSYTGADLKEGDDVYETSGYIRLYPQIAVAHPVGRDRGEYPETELKGGVQKDSRLDIKKQLEGGKLLSFNDL